jgi:membrane fusion protein, multidrug efflux system
MTEREQASILSRIRRMTAEAGGVSDAQLLDRFVSNRDEAAFELILRRHAQVVSDVCLHMLHDLHDAEDAFQATFLALAHHAGRIAKREAVAGWLYKVAYRTALTARGRRARRRTREKLIGAAEDFSTASEAKSSPENQELRRVLDQEIGRLPERFRSVVVLCYLEGKSVDEAALLLGCPRGTVASRLARARGRLQLRLAGRGFALTAVLTILTTADAAPRHLSLIPKLTEAAFRYTTEGAAADGVLSPRITALTEEVLRTMFLNKLKTGIVILIAFLGILLASSGLAVSLRAKAGSETDPPNDGEVAKPQAADKHQEAKDKRVVEGRRTVTVSRPIRRQAAPYQDYAGRLEARRSVEVRPAVSGFVVKVCFKAGAEVKKGDVLFELDPRAAQLTLEKAEAELSLAKLKLEQSHAELKRIRNLKETGAATPEAMDRITERAATAEVAFKIATVEVARAKLELDATKVTAPMSGRVSRSLVEEGTLVFRGQDRATLLTTVTALDPISLIFDMDERAFLDYQRLLREQKVKGTGSPLRMRLGVEEEFLHEGTLESIEDHLDPANATVRMRGSFPNRDGLLRPGLFVRVRMTLGPPRAVLEIPDEAILSDQGRKYVLVVNDRNVVERRAVTLGPIDNDMRIIEKGLRLDNGMRIIEKGLRAEDWVVIAGHVRIRPGDLVEPQRKVQPAQPDASRDRGH